MCVTELTGLTTSRQKRTSPIRILRLMRPSALCVHVVLEHARKLKGPSRSQLTGEGLVRLYLLVKKNLFSIRNASVVARVFLLVPQRP